MIFGEICTTTIRLLDDMGESLYCIPHKCIREQVRSMMVESRNALFSEPLPNPNTQYPIPNTFKFQIKSNRINDLMFRISACIIVN